MIGAHTRAHSLSIWEPYPHMTTGKYQQFLQVPKVQQKYDVHGLDGVGYFTLLVVIKKKTTFL